MKKNLLSLTILLQISLGCTQLSGKEEVTKVKADAWDDKKEIPVDICYVLCDFSASLSSNDLQSTRENVLRIYQSVALRSKLKVYDINTPQFGKPFFEFSDLMKNANKQSQRKKLKDKADAEVDTLKRLLSRPTSATTTCIIRSIDIVARSLENLPAAEKNQRIQIIILSDMLEDCTFNNVHINVDKGKIAQEKKKVEKITKPSYTFSKYKNLTISLTTCSQKETTNVQDLKEFWKLVLQKYDYNLTTSMNCELPDWVK